MRVLKKLWLRHPITSIQSVWVDSASPSRNNLASPTCHTYVQSLLGFHGTATVPVVPGEFEPPGPGNVPFSIAFVKPIAKKKRKQAEAYA